MVLIVCAPLNRRVHQTTKWATLDVHHWLAHWRRTRPCSGWTLAVSLQCCGFVFGGRLIVGYVVWDVVGYVVGVEARVRGVDCVCATEPPCSSANDVSPALEATIKSLIQRNREV